MAGVDAVQTTLPHGPDRCKGTQKGCTYKQGQRHRNDVWRHFTVFSCSRLENCLPLLLQDPEHVVKVNCWRMVSSCSLSETSWRCSVGVRLGGHASQSMWVARCCCKKLLTAWALCWIPQCPMACSAWSAPGLIASSLKPMHQVPLDAMQGCSVHHHSHCAPTQWHHGSTLLDISKLKWFNHWRTGWTVKDRVNHDSSVKSTLDHARWCWAQVKQAAQLACTRLGWTVASLEQRIASWSWLWIILLLMLTFAVHSCVLKALALAVLSLGDIRTTK